MECVVGCFLVHSAASVDPLDPMFPYTQYYDLANYSVDTFIKIRSEMLTQLFVLKFHFCLRLNFTYFLVVICI